MRAFIVTSMLVLSLFVGFSRGQNQKDAPDSLKERYNILQVGTFNVQSGVDLPPEFAKDLPSIAAKHFKESKKFQEVLLERVTVAQGKEAKPILAISGTITDFDKGSRGKRYLAGGFGAGNARLFVTVRYGDAGDGRVLYEDKVVGMLSSGLFGGDTRKVLDELARALVENAKLMLLRPVPASDIGEALEATTAQAGEVADTQAIVISGHDLNGAQTKLNELAAAGYRMTDFRLTGNSSVRVTMQKSATSPQTYQYLVVHALSPGNVQKNLNKGAAEGYRLSPHTLSPLYGYTCVMEKSATPTQTHYEYRFRTSQREENAEKNVLEEQAQGFTLVESGHLLGAHVVIMEKQD